MGTVTARQFNRYQVLDSELKGIKRVLAEHLDTAYSANSDEGRFEKVLTEFEILLHVIQVEPIKDAIKLKALYELEGIQIAEVDCPSYEYYQSLPNGIKVRERVMVKLSWNSDKNYACYKSDVVLGYKL